MASGYLIEYARHGTMTLCLVAKTAAVVFLLISFFFLGGAPLVLLAALGDGLMGLAVYVVGPRRFPPCQS